MSYMNNLRINCDAYLTPSREIKVTRSEIERKASFDKRGSFLLLNSFVKPGEL